MASNAIAFSASVFTSLLTPTLLTAVSRLYRNRSFSSLYKPRHGPHRKHWFQQLFCCVRACCGHYLATTVVQLLILQSLPNNWSTSQNIFHIVSIHLAWISNRNSIIYFLAYNNLGNSLPNAGLHGVICQKIWFFIPVRTLNPACCFKVPLHWNIYVLSIISRAVLMSTLV
jgi:hypothetical protein